MTGMDLLERNAKFILFFIIVVGGAVRLDAGLHKEYFFHDDIFSLELINGSDWAKERTSVDNYNRVVDGAIFKEDLIVSDEEVMDYSFTEVLKYDDIHPPFYYWILHPVHALLSNASVTWWPGIILNILFYGISALFVFKLCAFFIKEKFYSLFPVAFFSFSPAMISSDMLIRMYSLLGMLSVIYVYYSIVCSKCRDLNYQYLAVGIICLMGALTHHYFIILSLITCSLVSIELLVKKRNKAVLWFVVAHISAAIFYLAIWPVAIQQIFHSKISPYVMDLNSGSLYDYILVTNYYLFSGGLVFFSIFLFLGVAKGFIKNKVMSFYKSECFVLLLISVLFLMFVYVSYPYDIRNGAYRYFFAPNILLICSFGVCAYLVLQSIGSVSLNKLFVSSALLLMFLSAFSMDKVQYLFEGKFSNSDFLTDFVENDYPTIIKAREDWGNAIFNDQQKDWTIVNVMPLIYEKSSVYIIYGDYNLESILDELGVNKNENFYVIASNDDGFPETVQEGYGVLVGNEAFKYHQIMQYRASK